MYRELIALPALKYASRANDSYVNKTLGQQLCAVCVPLVNECHYLNCWQIVAVMYGLSCFKIALVGKSHISEYLLELVNGEIKSCKAEWDIDIQCVVSDNAANMSHMRELLKKESGIPNTHVYGCQAHIANLVGKDFISSREIKGILLKVKE